MLEAHLQRTLRKQPTDAERRLWMHLRGKQIQGLKFRRQHPYETYILDFVCMDRKLVIEVDGSQHLGSSKDEARDAFLATAGFRVLRFWNHDVLARTTDVLEAIVTTLGEGFEAEPSPPNPPLEGEGLEIAATQAP